MIIVAGMSMTIKIGFSGFGMGGTECFVHLNPLHPQTALLERHLYNHSFKNGETEAHRRSSLSNYRSQALSAAMAAALLTLIPSCGNRCLHTSFGLYGKQEVDIKVPSG